MSSAQKKLVNCRNKLNAMTEERNQLIQLLGTACKYCNNLENYLRSKGVSRREIEDIKVSKLVSKD